MRTTHAVMAAAGLSALSVISMAALQAQPRDPTRVAAIFPPWTDGGRAVTQVAEAGGLVLRHGVIDAIVVTKGEDPDFVSRLYAAGAWAVIDPDVWGGCLAGREQPAS